MPNCGTLWKIQDLQFNQRIVPGLADALPNMLHLDNLHPPSLRPMAHVHRAFDPTANRLYPHY